MLGFFLYLSIAFNIWCLDKLCRNFVLNIIFSIFHNFDDIWKILIENIFYLRFMEMWIDINANANLFSKTLFSVDLILLEWIGLTVCKYYYRWYRFNFCLQSILFSLFLVTINKKSVALFKLTFFDSKRETFSVY